MEESRRFTRSSVHIDELRSKQDKKRRRRTVFYAILFLSVTVVFLAVCFFWFFRVSEIRIENNEIYTDEQITEILPFAVGDNLFSFETGAAETALRKALPYIGDVEIERSLPAGITVTVSERKAEMTLSLGDTAFLLSGDLRVLDKIGGNDITTGITRLKTGAVERCIVGETVTFAEKRAADDLLELYTYLSENGMMHKVLSIDMTSRFDITLDYEGRFTVYLASIDNMDIKIRFLDGILKQLSPDDTGYINLSNHREASVRLDEHDEEDGQTPETGGSVDENMP